MGKNHTKHAVKNLSSLGTGAFSTGPCPTDKTQIYTHPMDGPILQGAMYFLLSECIGIFYI
jgi:hypothetical protein